MRVSEATPDTLSCTSRKGVSKKLRRGPFDVICGNKILMYAQRPIEVCEGLKGRLAPGGHCLFIEPDHEDYVRTEPHSELFALWSERIKETAIRSGIRYSYGQHLAIDMKAAGLCIRSRKIGARVDGGSTAAVYELFARTVHGLAERMRKLEVLASTDGVPADLEQQFRHEAVTKKLRVKSGALVYVSASKASRENRS